MKESLALSDFILKKYGTKNKQHMKTPLKAGDPVIVRDNDYGYFRFHQHMPPNHGGIKAKTCQVLHSSRTDFSFALIKTFRLSSVKIKK